MIAPLDVEDDEAVDELDDSPTTTRGEKMLALYNKRRAANVCIYGGEAHGPATHGDRCESCDASQRRSERGVRLGVPTRRRQAAQGDEATAPIRAQLGEGPQLSFRALYVCATYYVETVKRCPRCPLSSICAEDIAPGKVPLERLIARMNEAAEPAYLLLKRKLEGRSTRTPLEAGPPLTQAAVDELADGTMVLIRWATKKVAARYMIRVDGEGRRYATFPLDHILLAFVEDVGPEPPMTVVRLILNR